jgi:hypothetical protein
MIPEKPPPASSRLSGQREFGKNILGPILHDFCARLWLYQLSCRRENPAALYIARGGIRLRYLYELFLRSSGRGSACAGKDFFISRVAAAKGCLQKDFDYVARHLAREYFDLTVGGMLKALLPREDLRLPADLSGRPAGFQEFDRLYHSPDPRGETIRGYFAEQAALLASYIRRMAGGKTSVLLIDTGWTATTQAMLMRAFPEITWTGLYFGRWDYRKQSPWHFGSVIGISVDGAGYDPLAPRTALFHHHHLIEAPLEPAIPSVEEYVRDERTGEAVSDAEKNSEISAEPDDSDTHYSGIIEYFMSVPGRKTFLAISKDAEAAYERLPAMILRPSRREFRDLLVDDRSADYGRGNSNPILCVDPPGAGLVNKSLRIRRSLWKEGQIVFEFPAASWFLLRLLYAAFFSAALAAKAMKLARRSIPGRRLL